MRLTKHVMLTFEELIQQNLIKALDYPRIHISVELSEQSGTMDFSADYAGAQYNILSECDPLSLAVLKSAIREEEYSFDETKEYGNRVYLKIGEVNENRPNAVKFSILSS